SPDQIREAAGIVSLTSVQNEFSPRYRSSLPELRLCTDMGVAFLPYTPLGGINSAAQLHADHAEFAAVARVHGVSPQQVALAWELAQSDVVIAAGVWGKAKTCVQVAAIFCVIAFGPALWVDLLVYAAVAITVVSGVEFFFGMRRREAAQRAGAGAASSHSRAEV
ncbi:MAG: hypothetical protein KY433_00655, partial [Actinobacteria bacterium]|nr:hypothetical protein [Actinomycetota bacterium]